MKYLLIDDLRVFKEDRKPDDFDIARNPEDAIELLQETYYDVVYWDHDLGGDRTALEVSDWLLKSAIEKDRIDIGLCIIHTSNPAGAVHLTNTLTSRYLKYPCVRVDATEIFEVTDDIR